MAISNRRVALMIPDLSAGGAEKVTLNLGAGLVNRGYSVDLIVKRLSGERAGSVPDGINVISLDVNRMSACFTGLYRYIKKNRPAAIISALELPNLLSILAVRAARVPTRTISTTHIVLSEEKKTFTFARWFDRLLIASLYPFASHQIAVSEAVAEGIKKYLFSSHFPVKVIYNPVIPANLERLVSETVELPWKDSSNPIFLASGRMTAPKDFITIIDAFSNLLKIKPAHLIILGNGPDRAGLQARITALGLDSQIWMPGFVKNPYPFIRASSAFILSSLHEALPTVVIEAMACNCPVIATDCPGGIREILGGGTYGHLIPIQDPEQMVKAAICVLNGDVRLAPSAWINQFTIEYATEQYIQLFNSPAPT